MAHAPRDFDGGAATPAARAMKALGIAASKELNALSRIKQIDGNALKPPQPPLPV
jgi:hypothetical protein